MLPLNKPLIVLGRIERVSFPELDLYNLEAKIDTGAYSTAIHCEDICIVNFDDIPTLCFTLLDPEHPDYNHKEIRFTEFELKPFKSSFGETEERYVIKTLIQIGTKKIRTKVSLTSRLNMRYPILVGRKLLKNRFLVDVSLTNCLSTTN